MPIHKILASKRGRMALAALAASGVFGAWHGFAGDKPINPTVVHEAVAKGLTPPAVKLAVDRLIKPWEGLRLKSYRDSVGVWTICYGETRGVHAGMVTTVADCEQRLARRVTADYYMHLVDSVKDFTLAPVSVQAAMISGAYNFGFGAKTTYKYVGTHEWRKACEAQTAFNRAGGHVNDGLVRRREMGDAQRLGEAELCVSGL